MCLLTQTNMAARGGERVAQVQGGATEDEERLLNLDAVQVHKQTAWSTLNRIHMKQYLYHLLVYPFINYRQGHIKLPNKSYRKMCEFT